MLVPTHTRELVDFGNGAYVRACVFAAELIVQQATWVVQRHDVGVIRLVYPVVLWSAAMELSPGVVIRIK